MECCSKNDMAFWYGLMKYYNKGNCWIHNFTKLCNLDECRHAFVLCVPTFKEQVGFGDVQLVPKWCTSVLHAGARLKLHANLQLIQEIKQQQNKAHYKAIKQHKQLNKDMNYSAEEHLPDHWLCGNMTRELQLLLVSMWR